MEICKAKIDSEWDNRYDCYMVNENVLQTQKKDSPNILCTIFEWPLSTRFLTIVRLHVLMASSTFGDTQMGSSKENAETSGFLMKFFVIC